MTAAPKDTAHVYHAAGQTWIVAPGENHDKAWVAVNAAFDESRRKAVQ